VRNRSNTMTFGAISRNVLAKSSRASALANLLFQELVDTGDEFR
jgi:hypothetical protein